ncbi:hypothetical protein LEP1GSC043_0644 [Leptospira weilii str. Ecochallenge]|uniref:Uncharacterized protein n=1 Tax=Leptospira weilii str. Ecochallenge TaxID=1049986 RepID=N1UB69_9LEPT|nr:hypothetical protein LEP1GSC043_0644 [Leptospira weilii str. Ecochallenge]
MDTLLYKDEYQGLSQNPQKFLDHSLEILSNVRILTKTVASGIFKQF